MSRTYSLDAQSAKQAGASNYINETGKYVGTFKRAEAITSKKLTEGIEFTFVSDSDQTADYLTCWTYNVDGGPLYGLKMLNALMTCMRVKEITPKAIQIKDRDGSMKSATCFLEMMDKPIGVLLQREEYEKQDGSAGFKFNIVGCFDARSSMTASEVLEKSAKPAQLDKWVAQLKDKPMQARRETTTYGAAAPYAPAKAAAGSGFDDMTDDIPF